MAGETREEFERDRFGTAGPVNGTFGPAYVEERDGVRIRRQLEVIRALMVDCNWRTLREIEEVTSFPQASISAQLRHLRKPRFGGYIVEKRYREDLGPGVWEYRISP